MNFRMMANVMFLCAIRTFMMTTPMQIVSFVHFCCNCRIYFFYFHWKYFASVYFEWYISYIACTDGQGAKKYIGAFPYLFTMNALQVGFILVVFQ